jgi:hypothetical protein
MKTSVGFMGMANALHLLSEIEELISDNKQLIKAQLINIELKENLTHAVIELRDFLTTIKKAS